MWDLGLLGARLEELPLVVILQSSYKGWADRVTPARTKMWFCAFDWAAESECIDPAYRIDDLPRGCDSGSCVSHFRIVRRFHTLETGTLLSFVLSST